MGARGEQTLTIGGAAVRVLLTNRALARVESTMGRTVLQIADDARSGTLGMNQVAQLLQAGMQAAEREDGVKGKPVSLDEAFDVLDAVGFAEGARVVVEALAEVLGYEVKEGEESLPPE